jgi:hypothetical protein
MLFLVFLVFPHIIVLYTHLFSYFFTTFSYHSNDDTSWNRVWTYQTCAQFGFYQTCDPGTSCVFTTAPHINNIAVWLRTCQLAYGVLPATVQADVEYSNT